MNADDRHSTAGAVQVITDPEERARQEAENGLRQFQVAMEFVRTHIRDVERPFKLRPSHIIRLNREALAGIDTMAGAYRNTSIEISKSNHTPPDYLSVPGEIELMCDYVNDNWHASAVHLSAYLMWRINWIHPFVDGNGRTSRVVSYMVLNIRLDSMLPGVPTIPEQIARNKAPYYAALESADAAWAESGEVDVSAMETLLESMLAQQLYDAANQAAEA